MSPEAIWLSASVAGASVGAVAEWHAAKKVAAAEQALTLPHVEEALRQDAADSLPHNVARRARVARYGSRLLAKALLPLTIAAFSGVEAYSLTPVEQPDQNQAIELAVDDSGATQPVIGQIRQVVAQFSTTKAEAIVGNTGEIHSMRASSFAAFSRSVNGAPAGEAPLNQQVTLAFNRVAESNKHSRNAKGEVVLIDNGNTIGDTNALADLALAQNTALNVINVERDGTPPDLVKKLQRMAETTKGSFWSANSHNLSDVAQKVKAALVPDKAKVPSQDPWPYRLSGLMALLAGLGIYRSREKLLMGRDPKGE